MAPSDAPTPDEIEQRQPATPEDEGDELDVTDDRPLTPDEIEQRQEVGWDDDEYEA